MKILFGFSSALLLCWLGVISFFTILGGGLRTNEFWNFYVLPIAIWGVITYFTFRK